MTSVYTLHNLPEVLFKSFIVSVLSPEKKCSLWVHRSLMSFFPKIKQGGLNVDKLYDVSFSRGTKADIVSRKFVIVCLNFKNLKIVLICLKSMTLKKSSQFIIPLDIV
jgi:hypothetical protein